MIPSDVVEPTRRPACPRMWAIIRVTVLLPFVPEMETIGMRRAPSRTIVGPWAKAPAIRQAAATTSGWSEGTPLRVQPLLGRRAARPSRRASAPAPRRATGTRRPSGPGRRRGGRATSSAGPFPAFLAEPPAPAGEAGDRRRPTARRDVRPQPRGDALGGVALAVPGLLGAHGDLDLHRRLEAVEVRALPGGGSRRVARCAEDSGPLRSYRPRRGPAPSSGPPPGDRRRPADVAGRPDMSTSPPPPLTSSRPPSSPPSAPASRPPSRPSRRPRAPRRTWTAAATPATA